MQSHLHIRFARLAPVLASAALLSACGMKGPLTLPPPPPADPVLTAPPRVPGDSPAAPAAVPDTAPLPSSATR